MHTHINIREYTYWPSFLLDIHRASVSTCIIEALRIYTNC